VRDYCSGFHTYAFDGFKREAETMIFDIEPIAHIAAGSVDGQGLAGQGVNDCQRDKLFRELIRTVVVGAVRRGGLESEGL